MALRHALAHLAAQSTPVLLAALVAYQAGAPRHHAAAAGGLGVCLFLMAAWLCGD